MTTIEERYQDLNNTSAQDINIKSAIYGASGQFVDVTERIPAPRRVVK